MIFCECLNENEKNFFFLTKLIFVGLIGITP